MSFTNLPKRTSACSISWWPSYQSFLPGPRLATQQSPSFFAASYSRLSFPSFRSEPAEAHERLLHFLVAVIPVLLARPEVGHPAIPKLLRGVVQPFVLSFGQRVMVDRGFDEVTRDVSFMIAAMAR